VVFYSRFGRAPWFRPHLLPSGYFSKFTVVQLCDIVQCVSRLVNITAGGDFLGLCDQKSSHKHVSDLGRLQNYDRLKLRIESNDY